MTCFWHSVINLQRNPVLVFDSDGLALLAVSGAHKALAYRLNPVMATLLGMLTGIGAGMVRDVILVQIPPCGAPSYMRSPHSPAQCSAAGFPS